MPIYTFYCMDCKNQDEYIVPFDTLNTECIHCQSKNCIRNVYIESSNWSMEGGTGAQSDG